jgi:hypothetical protein
MNSLELIELQAKARCQRAWEAYHTAMMSAHENIPDAPNLLDCIAESVLDFYCRSVEDLDRVQKMRATLTNR